MKPERTLRAAGLFASHCESLFSQPTEQVDPLPEIDRLGERLARALGPSLIAFFGGNAPEVRIGSVTRMTGDELAGKILPLAANCVLAAGDGPHRMLVSIEATAILAQLDRAFGGTGQIAAELSKTLPLSADLLAHRMERTVADALAPLIERAGQLRVVERGHSYPALAPFADGDDVVGLVFEIGHAGAGPWSLTVATQTEFLASTISSPAGRSRRERPVPGPLDDPFAGLPLTLEAVLAELTIPLSRLAAIAPGQTIPIPVARAVPLRIGGTVVARGTVGEFEDRTALQLTSSMFTRKDTK